PESQQRNGRPLHGHTDIVSGCCFTPDGRALVSWGHDRTVRVWDPARARQTASWQAHGDRVTAGTVGPCGRWFVSGGRGRLLKLWDLQAGSEGSALALAAEVRACLFLLDGESLIAADAGGRLTVHTLPGLEQVSELTTEVPVQCAELSPGGSQLVLGGSDG